MLKPNRFSKLLARLVLVLPLMLVGTIAFAQSKTLDAPRASGAVGERFDGYAVIHDPTQAATLGPIVTQVNAERQKVYTNRAASDKVPVDQIGRIYAGQIMNSAPAGTWFLQESGQWVQK